MVEAHVAGALDLLGGLERQGTIGLPGLSSLAPLVQGPEVEYVLTLPGSGGETEVFFSDLSEEYVTYNSEYTS